MAKNHVTLIQEMNGQWEVSLSNSRFWQNSNLVSKTTNKRAFKTSLKMEKILSARDKNATG